MERDSLFLGRLLENSHRAKQKLRRNLVITEASGGKSLGARATSLKYIVSTKINHWLSINVDWKLKMHSKTKSEKFFNTATQSLTIELALMRDNSRYPRLF